MGTATKIRKSQSVMVVCLVLALLCANMNRACCFNSIIQTGDWGNSNSTAARVEYVNDDDEEFLMESEVSRRILATANGNGGINYDVLKGGKEMCSSPDRYGNCLPIYNQLRRKCDIENRCSRNVN